MWLPDVDDRLHRVTLSQSQDPPALAALGTPGSFSTIPPVFPQPGGPSGLSNSPASSTDPGLYSTDSAFWDDVPVFSD